MFAGPTAGDVHGSDQSIYPHVEDNHDRGWNKAVSHLYLSSAPHHTIINLAYKKTYLIQRVVQDQNHVTR